MPKYVDDPYVLYASLNEERVNHKILREVVQYQSIQPNPNLGYTFEIKWGKDDLELWLSHRNGCMKL